jgi:hypothetical protein
MESLIGSPSDERQCEGQQDRSRQGNVDGALRNHGKLNSAQSDTDEHPREIDRHGNRNACHYL